MWDSAIQLSTQFVTDALLHRAVMSPDALAFQKISGALAVRTALRVRNEEQTLIFVVPEATAATARHITAALLIGDYAHRHAEGRLPFEEARRLLKGDMLLVTQAVSESKLLLDDLIIGKGQRLSDIWRVDSLSKYTTSKGDKPRVFISNPGWLLKTAGRRFAAVVIDASHPRTFEQLPELMKAAAGCSSLRYVVSPPMTDAALSACGYPGNAALWVWDPKAQQDAQIPVESNDPLLHVVADRFLWVCDSDSDTAASLANLHNCLVEAARAAGGKGYAGLKQCWGIYNTLRQLVVPLAQLEQLVATTWAGTVRARIDALDTVHGYGNVAWETTWPRLVSAVKNAYQTLLKRDETAKFWAVAANIEAFIRSNEPHLRIVVGTEAELALLVSALAALIDGFDSCLSSGRIELVTSANEARLVAEGQLCQTILLAPRTNGYRYLDVYSSRRVDEFIYPHEVAVERASENRLYGNWIHAQSDERRVALLQPLGFVAPRGSKPLATTPRPTVSLRNANAHTVALVDEAAVSADLDIDALIDATYDGSAILGPGMYRGTCTSVGPTVNVVFDNGDARRYSGKQKVDVYFSGAELLQRRDAALLQPGWHVISFVDGRYDGLFQRLTEVVTSRRPMLERVTLELWRTSKEHIAARYETKVALYEKLVSKGLTSGYGTFIRWFDEADSDPVLAPQQFSDFKILASEAETYNNAAILDATFSAIQHERGRNRAMGRKLRKFLRVLVSGNDIEKTLDSARKLDKGLADVLAAVELMQVVSVRIHQRSQDAGHQGTCANLPG
jgi:hypothetical protein